MEDDKSYQDHTESFGNKPLILANDMDMSGNGWTPIGYHTEYNGSNHFAGEFDGNGHTISNVSISGDDYSGLFSFVSEEGYIHDLAIKGITVMNGSYLGTIAGRNDGTIENCSILEGENSVTSSGDYILYRRNCRIEQWQDNQFSLSWRIVFLWRFQRRHSRS